MQAASQVGAGDDIAPLVGTADLQHAAVALVEFGEVVALQQAVGELGVGNALVFAGQALLYGFLLDHGVDREMLADVAQEFEAVHAAEPVVVVCHDGRVGAFKLEEGLDLLADVADPGGNHVRRVELAFGRLEARVADHAGGAADQGDRLVAGFLEALEDEHRHQMAEVQAVGRRVEAAIERYRFLSQQLVERLGVGDLGDQAALVQILDEGGLVHGKTLHWDGRPPNVAGAEKFGPAILAEAGGTRPASARLLPLAPRAGLQAAGATPCAANTSFAANRPFKAAGKPA